MYIDFSDVVNKKIETQNIELNVSMGSFTYDNEEIGFNSPICFNGTIKPLGDLIILEGTASTELKLICSRCADVFNFPVNLEILEKFSLVSDNDASEISNKSEIIDLYEDVTELDDSNIDISNVLENNIILLLPMKKLCKKDCKGLCQKCGTNLNFSTCNCEDTDIDPRLEKLRDLFAKN